MGDKEKKCRCLNCTLQRIMEGSQEAGQLVFDPQDKEIEDAMREVGLHKPPPNPDQFIADSFVNNLGIAVVQYIRDHRTEEERLAFLMAAEIGLRVWTKVLERQRNCCDIPDDAVMN
jgi:hypothetical protein